MTTHHGMRDFTARSIDAAEQYGIAHEVVDGIEVARPFPMFRGLSGNDKAYYEAEGGYVVPEACIAVQRDRAVAMGARVRTGVVVHGFEQNAAGVRVETSDGTLIADRVVVSAGAWSAPLLGATFERLLTVSRQLLYWSELDDTSAYGPDSPVFIWMYGKTDTDYLYGFPPLPGDARVKVAKEQYLTTTTADAVDRTIASTETESMYRENVEGHLAGVISRLSKAAVCLYTVTPDRGFIIDSHPTQDRVPVVSACSGHGFKHSAGIGLAMAERLTEGRSRVDLAPFALSRFLEAR